MNNLSDFIKKIISHEGTLKLLGQDGMFIILIMLFESHYTTGYGVGLRNDIIMCRFNP